MIPAYKEIQSTAAALVKSRKLVTDPATKEKIDNQLYDLQDRLRKIIVESGGYIRQPEKSRFTCIRGEYYCHRAAVEVRDLIDRGVEDEILPTRLTASSAIQYFRHGLAYLVENLDPTGKYSEWEELYSFAKRGGDVKVQRKNRVLSVASPMMTELNWQLQIVEWMKREGDIGELTIKLHSLTDYTKLQTFILKYPGIAVKGLKGMEVTLHLDL